MNAGNYREALNRAPSLPFSGLSVVERDRLVRQRHEANVERWLREREPRPILAPLRAWLASLLAR